MEANEAMIEMAKRIGERNTGTFTVHPERGVRQLDDETVALIRQTAINAALAAIIETQEATASWLEQYPTPMNDLDMAMRIRQICAAIRTGEHYALRSIVAKAHAHLLTPERENG